MNRLANLILLNIITVSFCFAQFNNNMIIHQADGKKYIYPTESIDSITFIEKEASPIDMKNSKISFTKIYGETNSYCAFTSLIKRDNVYYVAFREGKTHVSSDDYGFVRILKSIDLDHWEILCTIKKQNVDLRDPCLSIMPDGKLLLTCGVRMINEIGSYETRTYYSKECDGFFLILCLQYFLNYHIVVWFLGYGV